MGFLAISSGRGGFSYFTSLSDNSTDPNIDLLKIASNRFYCI